MLATYVISNINITTTVLIIIPPPQIHTRLSHFLLVAVWSLAPGGCGQVVRRWSRRLSDVRMTTLWGTVWPSPGTRREAAGLSLSEKIFLKS